MAHVTYKIVRHEDGWAYTVDEVFSESFATHAEALKAAQRARASSAHRADRTSSQRRAGQMARERALGSDRPDTDVEDKP